VAPPVAAGGPARPPAPGPSAGSAETEPDGYLRRVREEYEAGRVREALDLLDQFRARFPAGSDEAWWLYGQLLEAEGPGRDIRSALDYYRRLTREYPQSPRYAEARRRIAYLERYYFNIQ
jgi:Tfp pilus assembly protein PilF